MRNKLLVIERQVDYMDKIAQMKEKIAEADAVVIGAGAGLSTAAGFTYNESAGRSYLCRG